MILLKKTRNRNLNSNKSFQNRTISNIKCFHLHILPIQFIHFCLSTIQIYAYVWMRIEIKNILRRAINSILCVCVAERSHQFRVSFYHWLAENLINTNSMASIRTNGKPSRFPFFRNFSFLLKLVKLKSEIRKSKFPGDMGLCHSIKVNFSSNFIFFFFIVTALGHTHKPHLLGFGFLFSPRVYSTVVEGLEMNKLRLHL